MSKTDNSATLAQYCHDPRHAEPCPLPCHACKDDCDPKYISSDPEPQGPEFYKGKE